MLMLHMLFSVYRKEKPDTTEVAVELIASGLDDVLSLVSVSDLLLV